MAAPESPDNEEHGILEVPPKKTFTREEMLQMRRNLETFYGSRLSEANDAAARHKQELYAQDNELAEFKDITKGLMSRGPNAWKNATMLYDYVMAQVATITTARPLFHPGRKWPSMLQIMGAIIGLTIFGAFTYSVMFTPNGAELGAALQKPSNQYPLIIVLILVFLIVLVLVRRKREKPVMQP